MTGMRITQNSMNRTQLAGLNTSLGRLQQTQEQLTTGKRISRPSDDPVGTVSALRFRDEQSQLEQFGQNITDGLSRLSAADDALTQTANMTNSIRTQTIAALNGVNGADQRKAYAESIRQLREGLLQQANGQYGGLPLFGGTTPNGNAFDPATGEYQGNTFPVLRQINGSPGEAGQMNVGVNGDEAFGDALSTTGALAKLADAIEAGDLDGMREGLNAVDTLRSNISNVHSSVGVRVNRLQGLENLNGRQDDASRIALSKVEDTDFMKAAMDLSIQSNAYQAALSASAKVIQPTLVDFIR
ncbi:flagellar hook-associated protein FlgL [Agilicoccus flavus]|uniref:flagellar hook-associated protein FlgL n=1 Tax=Agilicoccus flavus TaxID=2775968 RepID=UPI001CF68FD7|nr:flagellar hook-associated protein FlgL [Agilicoccus flavus]